MIGGWENIVKGCWAVSVIGSWDRSCYGLAKIGDRLIGFGQCPMGIIHARGTDIHVSRMWGIPFNEIIISGKDWVMLCATN